MFRKLREWIYGPTYQLKSRESFLTEEGWINVNNAQTTPMFIMIEPWGDGLKLAPGEHCYVHLTEYPPSEYSIAELNRGGNYLVFDADAIYQNGIEVCDFSDPPLE